MADLEIMFLKPPLYRHFPSLKILHWQDLKWVVFKLNYYDAFNFLFLLCVTKLSILSFIIIIIIIIHKTRILSSLTMNQVF